MKGKILAALLVLVAAPNFFGQTVTNLTAQIQDSQGVLWVNGPYTVTFVQTGAGTPYTKQGQSFTQQFSGTLNGSGQLSITVTDVNNIIPVNSNWKICVTPAVSSPTTYCVTLPVTGAAYDASLAINAIIQPPAVTGLALATAYADSEVTPLDGNIYYRTDGIFRCHANGVWVNCGSNGSSGVASVSGTAHQIDVTGTTTPVLSLDPAIILPGSMVGSNQNYFGTAYSFTATTDGTTNVLTGVSSFTGLESTQPITGPGIPIGATITGTNSGAGTVTISVNTNAAATGTFIVPQVFVGASTSFWGQNVNFSQNVNIAELNGWDVNVKQEYPFAATPGAALIDCANDVNSAKWPNGSVCDMRGFVGTTQPWDLGTAPIEIGVTNQTFILWPNGGSAQLNTISTTLATPSAPTLTTVCASGCTSTGSGNTPAATYFVEVNYRTGDGVSASSAEASATLPSSGQVVVTGPATCPQYAGGYDVTIATTTGAELLQGNVSCGSTFTLNTATLYLGSPAAPTVATALPGIILHNNKSGMYADVGSNSQFEIYASASAGMSNLIATVGNGYSAIKHMFFYNSQATSLSGAVFYDTGNYVGSVRDYLQVESSSNNIVYKIIGQFNDVAFQNLSLACFSPATLCTPLEILGGYGNAGDTESIHELNFNGGAIVAPSGSNTATGIIIKGKSSTGQSAGSGLPGGIFEINFNGTSIELGGQTYSVQITDATQVNFNGINETHSSGAGGTFLQINATGTTAGGAAIPTAGNINIQNGSTIGEVTNLVVNNITSVTTAGNLTNPFNDEFHYQAGNNVHSTFTNIFQGYPAVWDSASAQTYNAISTYAAGINLSGASSPLQVGGSAGTSGWYLVSQGAGTTPIWQALSLPAPLTIAGDIITNGGSFRLQTSATNEFQFAMAGTSLRLFDSVNSYLMAQFTQGSSIVFNAEGSGSISFNSSANAGTGGYNFYSGGASSTLQASISSAGLGTFKSLSVGAARKGTFVCTSGGSIVVANANYLITSDVVITMNTPGGTVTYAPNINARSTGVSFTAGCASLDTSTYNYDIFN